MSGFRRQVGAAVSAALLVSVLAPAGAQGPTTPQRSGTLASGVSYTIAPDTAQTGAAIALWYRAPNAGFDATPMPGLARLAAVTVAGSNPVTGTPLGQLVARYGGRLAVAAYPDSVAITAVVPPEHVADTVRAMTGDYFAPVTDAKGLELAKREVGDDALYASFDPEQALEDQLGAALFAAGPLHDGTIGKAQAIQQTTLDRVRTFAERAFRPDNAVLVLTGNIAPNALDAVASRAGAAGASAAEAAATQSPLASPASLQNAGNVDGIGLGWVGPPIADEGAATALDFVADALFTSRTGLVQKALGPNNKAVVTGKFVTYHNPGVFLVTISGDGAAAARPVVERVLKSAAKPLDPQTFATARAAFVYDVLSSSATPSDIADTFGWYTVEGNPGYAPSAGTSGRGRYLQLAEGLTPQSVASTVARYLGATPAVITLVKAPATPAAKTRS